VPSTLISPSVAWTPPGVTGLAKAAAELAAAYSGVIHPPPFLIPIYKAAGRRYHVQWSVLAAINSIESDYGRDLHISTAGAIGWMQFMRPTWDEYAVTRSGHGRPNPYDPTDAIFSAARYLAANGARHDLRGAIFAYNHAGWYVDQVVARAEAIAVANPPGGAAILQPSGVAIAPRHAPREVKLAIAAANKIRSTPYPEPDAHFGTLTRLWPAYDCSGAVSYVLFKAGLHSAVPDVAATLEHWGKPGPGRWITVYASANHTFIVIAGLAFDTADFGGPDLPGGTGPRWRADPIGNLADGASYVVRHPAGL
jgi:hypothetical protein